MAFLFAGLSSGGAADSSKADKPPGSPDRLVQILLGKGILTLAEVESLGQGSPAEQQARLIGLLRVKGVLSVAEAETLRTPPAAAQVSPALVASPPIPGPQAAKAEAPKVIPAVAPLRVLQLEPSLPNGMIPDIKLGSGAKLKIYGLLKASS